MLNSPILSIFQHFHAIPLRSPLISLRSKWRLTGFSRRFTPKNPVRLHNPFGELLRWGAKNVLPLNLIALPTRGRLCVGDTASPIQPPPLRGTSFHRKEGVSTRAPSLGRGCRAQRGGGWLPQQVEKEWKEAFPRFVIPSAAEGSFSFPVSVFFRNAVCMKHRPSDSLGARCFPLAAILTSFA